MRKAFAVTAAVALLYLGGLAQADVFNLGSGLTNLETVVVGDPGNAADTRYETPGYGAVGYTYIGKYEVTAAQYCDFLNNKAKTDTYHLYSGNMWDDPYGCKIQRNGTSGSYSYSVASDWANRPVNYVSYWDACRFTNWLHNGQGNGDTETGAYTLDGYNGADGRNIVRNLGARFWMPSEDEWYKAAYYKGGGRNAGYWDYPTLSDSAPSNVLGNPTDPGNSATYYNNGCTIGSPYYRTEVGAHENSGSAYDTFDQGGNVWEWNETVVKYANRGLRGGDFGDGGSSLQASGRSYLTPHYVEYYVGFRVAGVVPEPSPVIALACGLGSLLAFRRRRA